MKMSSGVRAAFEPIIREIKKKVIEEVKIVKADVDAQWLMRVSDRLRDMFERSVDEFYEGYTPISGGYDRRHSLYNLLEIRADLKTGTLRYEFIPENMTPFRNGYDGEDGLYDQVFRKGWHGGADKISPEKEGKYGMHPNTGTPYWRTPIKRYSRWGRVANIQRESPLESFNRKFNKYNSLSGVVNYQKDYDDIWRSNIGRIRLKY